MKWQTHNHYLMNYQLFELKSELANLEKKIAKPQHKAPSENYDELLAVLEATEVKIPAKLTGGDEDSTLSLLSIFQKASESLVTGVTNSMNSSDLDTFLYFNVCPKLQIHGLVINEKVAGVQWRRFAITQEGTKLLAYLDKEKILAKED